MRKRAAFSRSITRTSSKSACFENNSSAGAPLPLLQYGHYLLKKIWDDHLHLDRKFKDIQHRQTKAKFDLNAVVSYLCFLKILDPHSVFYSFGDQDGFLGAPVKASV